MRRHRITAAVLFNNSRGKPLLLFPAFISDPFSASRYATLPVNASMRRRPATPGPILEGWLIKGTLVISTIVGIYQLCLAESLTYLFNQEVPNDAMCHLKNTKLLSVYCTCMWLCRLRTVRICECIRYTFATGGDAATGSVRSMHRKSGWR